MDYQEINTLNDLIKLRSAPNLSNKQLKNLSIELDNLIQKADWFTIGVMAPTKDIGIKVIREIEMKYSWPKMNVSSNVKDDSPIFLKANQKTGTINIRVEHGLGEGILISCHYEKDPNETNTIGPLPLKFFNHK